MHISTLRLFVYAHHLLMSLLLLSDMTQQPFLHFFLSLLCALIHQMECRHAPVDMLAIEASGPTPILACECGVGLYCVRIRPIGCVDQLFFFISFSLFFFN